MSISLDQCEAEPQATSVREARLPLIVALPCISFMSVAMWVAIWQGVTHIL